MFQQVIFLFCFWEYFQGLLNLREKNQIILNEAQRWCLADMNDTRSSINENGGNVAVKICGSNHLITYDMWANHFLQKFIYKNQDWRDDSANKGYAHMPKTKNQTKYFYCKAIGAFYLNYLARVWFKILKFKRLTFLH